MFEAGIFAQAAEDPRDSVLRPGIFAAGVTEEGMVFSLGHPEFFLCCEELRSHATTFSGRNVDRFHRGLIGS